MKKAIIIIMMLLMILSLAPAIYADQEKDDSVPPIEDYAFNMTQEAIRDLLGVPHEEKESKVGTKSDEYFDIEYLGISGHLAFSYKDDKVNYVGWISPEISDQDIQKITDTVIEYYDEKYGTDEDVKSADMSDDMLKISLWSDDFNKRDTGLYIYNFDGKKHVEINFSKQK